MTVLTTVVAKRGGTNAKKYDDPGCNTRSVVHDFNDICEQDF